MTARRAAKDGLGVPLAAGILVFATMTLILAEIAEDVLSREPLTVSGISEPLVSIGCVSPVHRCADVAASQLTA